ncbi:MAG: PEGA domain-containing protein [bacterium]
MIRALALAAALLIALPAHAYDPVAADALKAEADKLFMARDYPAALEKLKAAYALDPQPGYIANQGLVLQRMGKAAEAVEAFDRFLATDPEPDKAAMARDVVERLRPEVEILSDPPGATVSTLDDKELGTTPLKSRLVVGEYTLVFSLRRYDPVEARLVVREGRKATISQTLVAQKNAPQLTEVIVQQKPGAGDRLWTWVALGGAAAAGAAAGVLYGLASSEIDDRDAARTSAAWDDHQASAETFSLGFWTAAGVGAAALVAGGILFFREGRAVSVQAGPGGIGLGGTF